MKLENLWNKVGRSVTAASLVALSTASASAAGISVDGWWGLDTCIVSPLASAKNVTYKMEFRMADGAIFKLSKDGSVVSNAKVVLSPAAAASFQWETGSDGVTPALRFTGKGRVAELYYICGNGKDTIATAKSQVFENVLSVSGRTLAGPYPRRIIDSKETGSVTVDVTVTKAGYVEGVSISKSNGVTNPHVRNEILSDALHLRFSQGNADQRGTVTYNLCADDYNEALAAQRKREIEERRRLHKEEKVRQNANSKVANAFSNNANSFELDGRKLAKAMPQPSCVHTQSGWVEVNVTVDNDGNVTKATLGRRSKEMTDQNIFNAAIEAAKATKFNSVNVTDMPNQLGTITYHFTAK